MLLIKHRRISLARLEDVFYNSGGVHLMKRLVGILLVLPLTSFAANYFVTQSGAGNHDGTSFANAWSVTDFNATSTPTGGDTVSFSGNFVSTIVVNTSGTGNGTSRLTLNFATATLNTADPRLNLNGQSYLNVNGGTIGTATNAATGLITFGGTQLHDVTINGWTHIGDPRSIAYFIWHQYGYNTVIANNTVDNVGQLVFGDSTLNHDITIINNFARSSLSSATDIDIVQFGDAYNVTIQGNKLVNQAVSNAAESHQDVIQNYEKGGGNAGNPTNWIVRYNWIETNDYLGGSGDNSWMMLQSMAGDPAIKIYGNVFVGPATAAVANNGLACTRNAGGVYYLYNNTFIRHNRPDNTIRFMDAGTLYAKNNVGEADPGISGTFLVWTMKQGGTWDHNFWYQFPDATGANAGPHGSTRLNPLFVNYISNDFSLSPTSPLKGAGDRTIGVEYNQGIAPGATWPNPRVVTRSAWDIGAYESSTSLPQPTPTPPQPRNLHIVPGATP
jgi:hypothetical protein